MNMYSRGREEREMRQSLSETPVRVRANTEKGGEDE